MTLDAEPGHDATTVFDEPSLSVVLPSVRLVVKSLRDALRIGGSTSDVTLDGEDVETAMTL